MEEDSIASLHSTDDGDIISAKTMGTLSICSVGIDEWTSECFNLSTLASETLPRVARFAEENPGSVPKKLESYLNCSLLLHSVSCKTVVKCRMLKKNLDGERVSVGPTLIVPDNYDGFFAVIPESGRISSYTSISDIASVMPKRFFTYTKLVGMCIVTSEKGDDKYIQRAIPEASVLKVDGVFSAKWKTEADTGIFKTSKMSYTTINIQYLKCIDPRRKTVYIPYTTEGRFHTMFDKDVSDQYALYRIKDLWRFFEFPLHVRLIYGTSPIGEHNFTNLICLNSKEELKSIVTSTIGHKRSVLLDIPVTTSVFVNLPVTEESAFEMDTVQEAITFADKYVSHFNRRIKESLLKIDEITIDEDEKDEREEEQGVKIRRRSRQMLKAKKDSMDMAANGANEIPLDLLKDVKSETATESNDWDVISVRERPESVRVNISKGKKQPKDRQVIFDNVGLEKSTIV